MSVQLVRGEALELLAALPEASVDAIVTDPPYGIGFCGHEWDQPGFHARPTGASRVGARTTIGSSGAVTAGSYDHHVTAHRAFQDWCEASAREAIRGLRPGGHVAAFGAPRTFHRLAAGLADAGLEIRDTLCWLFGGGLPRSKNLTGAHAGRGTALRPGWEPIVLARRPLAVRSVQRNSEAFGTGALAIDACRLPIVDRGGYEANCPGDRGHTATRGHSISGFSHGGGRADEDGRWPPNVLLSHDPECDATECAEGCVIARLDEQAGPRPAGGPLTGQEPSDRTRHVYRQMGRHAWLSYRDSGGASRFFYTAKTSALERDAGLRGRLPCEGCGQLDSSTHRVMHGPPTPCRRNTHPCVKPIEMMRWLCRLLVAPGGRLLDPFAGSATTLMAAHLEGLDAHGIERDPDHHRLAATRLAWWQTQPAGLDVEQILTADSERRRHHHGGQVSIDDLLDNTA